MKMNNIKILKTVLIVMIMTFIIQLACTNKENKLNQQAVPDSPQPQLQTSVPQMLEFSWSAGPAMPQGMQDNSVQVIDNWLVSVGGFCGGYEDDWKPGIYPRGFLNKVWGLDLAHEATGWVELTPLPAKGRQGMVGTRVNNKFYVWGGFNYTAPYTYKDGYRLSLEDNKWIWKEMPPLPLPLTWASAYAVGSRIYIFGGADYDYQRFYSLTDHTGEVKRLGARLISLDTDNLDSGWKELASYPGTPRSMAASAVVDGKIYAIGGIAVADSGDVSNIVDSWSYDPVSDTWERLRDFPVSGTSSSPGILVYQNRYILLPAAYQYENYMKPDGSVAPKYGTPSRVERTWKNHPSVDGKRYYNHFYVYDLRTNLYGTANNLPFDDVATLTIVLGDSVYLFPNETAGFVWDGEYFGHHPEFVLKGKIKVLDWE